jgi:hypothetical protein
MPILHIQKKHERKKKSSKENNEKTTNNHKDIFKKLKKCYQRKNEF